MTARSYRGVLVALVLGVTACSSGGAKQSSTTTTTTVAAPTTVATTTRSATGITTAQARADVMCRLAFGAHSLNAAPGTVGEVRSWEAGGPAPGFRIGKDAFRGASPRSL